MTLHPYRATCPIGRKMSEPCPCHLDLSTSKPVRDPPQWVSDIEKVTSWCNACLAEWEERAAILEHGQGTGGSPERPTCANRADAEAEATRQLREAVAAAESKQGRLF